MAKLQEFESAARINGYVEDGPNGQNAVWFTRTEADVGTNAHKRLCIDSLTDSATVFWHTLPSKFNSKTFRSVAALKEWFESPDR